MQTKREDGSDRLNFGLPNLLDECAIAPLPDCDDTSDLERTLAIPYFVYCLRLAC